MVRGLAVEPAHIDNCPIGYLYRAGIYPSLDPRGQALFVAPLTHNELHSTVALRRHVATRIEAGRSFNVDVAASIN